MPEGEGEAEGLPVPGADGENFLVRRAKGKGEGECGKVAVSRAGTKS